MKRLVVLLLLTSTLTVTGCWDRIEPEEVGYVATVGVDLAEDGMLEVTYEIANPQAGSAELTVEGEPEKQIISIVAPDFLTARDLVNTSMTRWVSFSHVEALIISAELARSDLALPVIGSTLRERQMRRDMFLIVSRESAKDFINDSESPLETRPHKFIQFMTSRWQDTGLVPLSFINRYMQRTEADTGLFLAVYASTLSIEDGKGQEDDVRPGEVPMEVDSPAQFVGSAVFKDGRMIGTLSGEETRLALFLRQHLKTNRMLMSFQDPQDSARRVAVRVIKHRKTLVHFDLDAQPPRVEVLVPLDVEVLGIPTLIDYVERQEGRDVLKQSIRRELEAKTKALVERTQHEFAAEPFDWSLLARTAFLTNEQFQALNWAEAYPHMDVVVHYEVAIREFGIQLRPPRIERIGE